MLKFTLQSLKKLAAWDEDSYRHSLRVAEYANKIACAMQMNWQDRKKLLVAALLHDIGKLDIPQEILQNPGSLTREEYDIIRTHTELGYKKLLQMGFPLEICKAVRDHHEQPDGCGYRRETDPGRYAEIIRVADCLDVMIAGRCYQKAKTDEDIRKDLCEHAGHSMERAVVNAALLTFFPKIA